MKQKAINPFALGLTFLVLLTQTYSNSEKLQKPKTYQSYVKECLKTLIGHATDTYGDLHTPILVSILDIETRTCPPIPEKLDEYFRVTRRDRRSPGGSNLLTDQPTLKAMYALSAITGDNTFSNFADNYSGYVMRHLIDEQCFFWWGWHRHYNVFKDRKEGHQPSQTQWGADIYPHEIHAIHSIDWDRLWKVDEHAVTKEIEAIWQWHVIDKNTGEINRHGDGNKGCDFTMSAGAFIEAFAFMYSKTNNQLWLNRTRQIADYYWKRRNHNTNLIPERPNAGKKRFDGSSFVTSITGLYCHALLKAYEVTGDQCFHDQAVAYLKAYARLGFDKKTGKFWGALKLDGQPIPGPRVYTKNIDSSDGYAAAQPRGHLDLWEP
ncbi:MAG: glycoside hydrolase family 76 protein, partial [Opitutales bacterium]|nr:glycoside hydrolase family 76 protein [Opitutales bacterium]